jgi:osmotically-inducible protein OsmY
VAIAQTIPGVRRIHNELLIADLTSFSSRSNDSWITSKVKAELLNSKDVDATRVKVVTEKGNVFLMGLVTEKEAGIAVDIARNVKEVSKVTRIFETIPEPTTTQPEVVDKK